MTYNLHASNGQQQSASQDGEYVSAEEYRAMIDRAERSQQEVPMAEETTLNDNPQPSQQQPQIVMHGGVFPQPDGRWMVGVWFVGFSSEASAQHMSGQLEQVIKRAFAPPPPGEKQ